MLSLFQQLRVLQRPHGQDVGHGSRFAAEHGIEFEDVTGHEQRFDHDSDARDGRRCVVDEGGVAEVVLGRSRM